MARKFKKDLILGPGTLSFPHLATPSVYEDDDKSSYSCTVLFDPENPKDGPLDDLEDAIEEAIEEIFGDKKPPRKFNAEVIKEGDEYEYEGFEGKSFIKASTQFKRPGLMVRRTDTDLTKADEDEVQEEFYAGCKVRVYVSLSYYDRDVNSGLTLYLKGVEKVGEGKRLDGQVSAGKLFDDDFEYEDDYMEDDGEEETPKRKPKSKTSKPSRRRATKAKVEEDDGDDDYDEEEEFEEKPKRRTRTKRL